MNSYLATFTANGKWYDHFIDADTVATFVVRAGCEETSTRLFTVDRNALVFEGNNTGGYLGRFRIRHGFWAFFPGDRKLPTWISKYSVDEAEGLLKAERDFFKALLEENAFKHEGA